MMNLLATTCHPIKQEPWEHYTTKEKARRKAQWELRYCQAAVLTSPWSALPVDFLLYEIMCPNRRQNIIIKMLNMAPQGSSVGILFLEHCAGFKNVLIMRERDFTTSTLEETIWQPISI